MGIAYFVMHPTEPFSWNLRSIVVHMDVCCILNPTVLAIKVIVVLEVLITVFIRPNQSADFQVIESGMSKQSIRLFSD